MCKLVVVNSFVKNVFLFLKKKNRNFFKQEGTHNHHVRLEITDEIFFFSKFFFSFQLPFLNFFFLSLTL